MNNERSAAKLLREKIIEIKIYTFDLIVSLQSLNEDELKEVGYKYGHGDAVLTCITRARQRIQRFIDAYLLQYPDDNIQTIKE